MLAAGGAGCHSLPLLAPLKYANSSACACRVAMPPAPASAASDCHEAKPSSAAATGLPCPLGLAGLPCTSRLPCSPSAQTPPCRRPWPAPRPTSPPHTCASHTHPPSQPAQDSAVGARARRQPAGSVAGGSGRRQWPAAVAASSVQWRTAACSGGKECAAKGQVQHEDAGGLRRRGVAQQLSGGQRCLGLPRTGRRPASDRPPVPLTSSYLGQSQSLQNAGCFHCAATPTPRHIASTRHRAGPFMASQAAAVKWSAVKREDNSRNKEPDHFSIIGFLVLHFLCRLDILGQRRLFGTHGSKIAGVTVQATL